MDTVRECNRCIMSSAADPELTVDSDGVCNHCRRYERLLPIRVLHGAEAERELGTLVAAMKALGKGRDYDCLIGVSGGVDSTYVAYLTKQLGLRPLAVHVDNGWNSELAVKNIELTLQKLSIDLYTEVLDWDEFRDLQMAFCKASTPDLDIPSDHAITAVMWRQARKHRIKYIVSGMNFATESTFVPGWAYGHWDWRYISGIHRQFGKLPLNTYPHYTVADMMRFNFLHGQRSISLLNYVDYNKAVAMKTLTDELGWRYYGGKHYESIYTRFIQGYVLPVKFAIDKRIGHLSDLIRAGQITRMQALEEIKRPVYDPELLATDYDFVVKKMGLSRSEFQAIMDLPPRTFADYKNSLPMMTLMRATIGRLRSLRLYPR